MAYQPIVQPTPTRRSQSRRISRNRQFLGILQVNFSLITWLLVGAIAQGIVLLIHPSIISLLPALSLFFIRIIDSCLMAYGLKQNIYMTDVIQKRTAGISIDEHGQLTDQPRKIAVMLLGAKSSHPFGVFAPGFSEFGARAAKMYKNLDENADAQGFLGMTSFTRYDERGALEFTSVMYWKDLASIHDFAHGPLHRETWTWWEATLKEHDCIGINHEMFEADAGAWETVYGNFQPTGYGATSYLRKGNKFEGGVVPDQWVSPLVDAARGKLARSSGRLGWNPTKHDEKHPVMERVYA